MGHLLFLLLLHREQAPTADVCAYSLRCALASPGLGCTFGCGYGHGGALASSPSLQIALIGGVLFLGFAIHSALH